MKISKKIGFLTKKRYPFYFKFGSKPQDNKSSEFPRIEDNIQDPIFSVNNKESVYDLKIAEKYIAGNIKKFDWPTYVIANYYPRKIRQDLFNINWLNIELMRIPESTREISLALGKIEFWNDCIRSIYLNDPPKEPVSIALHSTILKNKLPKKLETNTPNISDFAQLEQFAENIRTTMIFLNLKLLRIDYEKYPELILAAQHIGRCLGILDYIKRVPFGLRKYRLYMPEEILRKYNVTVRNLWDRVEGKPKEDLYDVILEVASFAKMHLEASKQYQKSLPPQAFRAMLHAVEAEYYLENLEKYNFNVFSYPLNAPSYMVLPYRVFKAARNNKFTFN